MTDAEVAGIFFLRNKIKEIILSFHKKIHFSRFQFGMVILWTLSFILPYSSQFTMNALNQSLKTTLDLLEIINRQTNT